MPDTSTLDIAIQSTTRPHGASVPLGATIYPGGVNFSVFSKHATGVQLVFFDRVDAEAPTQVFDLHPRHQRSYHYRHAFVPGITAGQYYGYRVDGPFDPERGRRAVELLPVFAFDDQDAPGGLNDWGYQPVSFFAPHGAYSSRPDALGALDEFRDGGRAACAGLDVCRAAPLRGASDRRCLLKERP